MARAHSTSAENATHDVFVFIGLAAGAVFGFASGFGTRVRGTVLAAVPFACWFIWFALSLVDGYSAREASDQAFALFGAVVGLFIGIAVRRLIGGKRTPSA